MTNKKTFKLSFANRDLIVELGKMANLSTQSVVVRYGNSVVLTTVNYNETPSNYDFLPLTVLFQEKLYALGKIPGGFLKREGFPGEYATLSARLIDRIIRPLFAEGFYYEVQVINSIFALDENSDIRFAAAFASTLVLALSGLPFAGPAAMVIIAKYQDKLVVNPKKEELINGTMELVVAGTETAINMVEAGCQDISEAEMITAIALAHDEIKKLIAFQKTIIANVKCLNFVYEPFLIPDFVANFCEKYRDEIVAIAKILDKKERLLAQKKLFEKIYQTLLKTAYVSDNEELSAKLPNFINKVIAKIGQHHMRQTILNTKKRLDGRTLNEIRPLNAMIDILPVVHGSGLFSRGETQVLSVLTLGALAEQQIIDDLGKEDYKRFMHHYNFPPFSVGETGRVGKPSRREIGHGALGEKALAQVIPSENDFPYTIRLVSEVLASNGSTSQAAICAASLALMAGGVPIRTAIAGIAMGLIFESDSYALLTDIQGIEDHLGDMDFKVAGTKYGICALQMDIKVQGLTLAILETALNEAKIARLKVLENMNAIIDKPRKELAPSAPKILRKQVPVDKIREIIGAGGKVINKIISDTGNVKIDISSDGHILIYHTDNSSIDKAWTMIDNIINPKPLQIGDEFLGKIVKITNFGVFVNLKDKIDGLVHISKFKEYFKKEHIESLYKFVKIDDSLKVRVVNTDDNGKISLDIITL